MRGDLHVHSDASSDARSALAELHDEGGRLGREYLAITDHSRSRPLGLDAAALQRNVRRIRLLDSRRHVTPHLLAEAEVDILADGTLDLPLEALRALDCIVASVHSRFSDPPEKMTRRIIRALRSGVVDILGHPTGRQLGARDAYAFDLDQVLEVAREEGVVLEVNAMPDRMDSMDKHCRLAKDAGVSVVISSDAHHATHLDNLRYGVWMARRSWLEPEDVLNTLPLAELRRHLHRNGAPLIGKSTRAPRYDLSNPCRKRDRQLQAR